MSKTKITSIIIGIIVLVAIAYSINTNKTDNTIKIGAVLSLTGTGAAYGQPAQNGLVLAMEDINSKGGINNKKLQVIYEDSQFSPTIGLSAYQSLNVRGIHFIITNGSAVSLAIRKPVVDNHDLQFETAAVTPVFSDEKSNTCRFTLTAPVSGKNLGDFVAKNLKVKTFATLTLNDDYGKAMADAVSRTVSSYGVKIEGAEFFDKDSSDFRTQITKLIALNPDVLLVVPAAGQAPAIFKQLKELNWKGVIVSDSWTVVNDNLKDLTLVEGDYFVNYDWNGQINEKDSESSKAFKSEYLARYGNNPPVVAANAYDSLELMAKAIDTVGSNDPEEVGQWLSNNVKGYNGVTGSITLNQDCEATRSAIIQQVKNGNFITVE